MPPLSTSEFAAVCRDAAPETVAGFVAALYEARGYAVAHEGDLVVVVSRAGAEDERLAVPDGDGPPPEVDRVVTTGRPPGSVSESRETLDAADLRAALLYGVDRERAADLLAEWFDRPLSSFEAERDPITPDAGGSDGRPEGRSESSAENGGDGDAADGGPESSRVESAAEDDRSTRGLRTAAVAVVTAMLVAGTVSLAFGVPAELRPGTGDRPNEISTPLARETLTAEEPTTPTGDADSTDGDGTPVNGETLAGAGRTASYPPGVDESGIVDYRALVDANRRVLTNRSYTVTVTYRELSNGTETALFAQTVAVGNATSYRVRTTRFGEFASSPPTLTDGVASDDGGTAARRARSDAVRSSADGRDRVLAALSRYLGYYLSVSESTVADVRVREGTTTVRLRSRGDPWPGVVNATGSAVVSDDGLVRLVRRAYDDPNSEVRVVVTVRISEVGRTAVSTPARTDEASRTGQSAFSPSPAAVGSS
ncbi:MAG: hypothetical protein ABEJ79_04310 [Halolamina sp.]